MIARTMALVFSLVLIVPAVPILADDAKPSKEPDPAIAVLRQRMEGASPSNVMAIGTHTWVQGKSLRLTDDTKGDGKERMSVIVVGPDAVFLGGTMDGAFRLAACVSLEINLAKKTVVMKGFPVLVAPATAGTLHVLSGWNVDGIMTVTLGDEFVGDTLRTEGFDPVHPCAPPDDTAQPAKPTKPAPEVVLNVERLRKLLEGTGYKLRPLWQEEPKKDGK